MRHSDVLKELVTLKEALSQLTLQKEVLEDEKSSLAQALSRVLLYTFTQNAHSLTIYSPTHSFHHTPSPAHLLIHSLTPSLFHALTHSLIFPLTNIFSQNTHSLYFFIQSLHNTFSSTTYSLTPFITQSLINSHTVFTQ